MNLLLKISGYFRLTGRKTEERSSLWATEFAVFGDDVERKWKHTVHYGSTGLSCNPDTEYSYR